MKNCNTQDLLKNTCPPRTKCVENLENQPEGNCQCRDLYVFNPSYMNDTDYCILNNKTSENNNIKNNDDSSERQIKSISKPHHILAGVLIPIAIVLIIISGVVVAQRIRKIRRTHHRNRPFYEDVMLGVNDNDDPPLI